MPSSPPSEILDAILAENRRLRAERQWLRERIRAVERSRWYRLNPRLLWPRGTHGREAYAHSAPSPEPLGKVRERLESANPRLARFVDEVLVRGEFTQEWFLGHALSWEPLLSDLEAQRARVLEVGSYEGLSACYILWRLPDARITCVDTFEGSVEHDSAESLPDLKAVFERNVALAGGSRVRTIVGDSRSVLVDLATQESRFDLVYLDGSHLGLDVIVDASLAWQLLEFGGVLVFDDYQWAELGTSALLRPGPAIDAFLALIEGHYELLFADYQLAVRKVRAAPPASMSAINSA